MNAKEVAREALRWDAMANRLMEVGKHAHLIHLVMVASVWCISVRMQEADCFLYEGEGGSADQAVLDLLLNMHGGVTNPRTQEVAA